MIFHLKELENKTIRKNRHLPPKRKGLLYTNSMPIIHFFRRQWGRLVGAKLSSKLWAFLANPSLGMAQLLTLRWHAAELEPGSDAKGLKLFSDPQRGCRPSVLDHTPQKKPNRNTIGNTKRLRTGTTQHTHPGLKGFLTSVLHLSAWQTSSFHQDC